MEDTSSFKKQIIIFYTGRGERFLTFSGRSGFPEPVQHLSHIVEEELSLGNAHHVVTDFHKQRETFAASEKYEIIKPEQLGY